MVSRVTAPLGRSLARIGITPNIVTLIGAVGVIAGALYFYPRGLLYAGSVVITVTVPLPAPPAPVEIFPDLSPLEEQLRLAAQGIQGAIDAVPERPEP